MEKASAEQRACTEIEEEIARNRIIAEKELVRMEPFVQEANGALECLDKPSLIELKSYTNPHPDVHMILKAVMTLSAGVMPSNTIPIPGTARDRAARASPGGREQFLTWINVKNVMSDVNKFVDELRNFKVKIDRQEVPKANFKEVEQYVLQEGFCLENIRPKSKAAGNICLWVKAIFRYWNILTI
jgi:dynein heavy chain